MRNWKSWIKAAGIRAIRTMAQTAIATIGAAAVKTSTKLKLLCGVIISYSYPPH